MLDCILKTGKPRDVNGRVVTFLYDSSACQRYS